MCIIREKLRTWKLKRMTSLNRLLLAVLQIAQVALIVVVVVYAAKDIRKGVSHRVLLGSLVALVVLVAVTPLVTNAAVVEGMSKDMQLVASGALDHKIKRENDERGERHIKGRKVKGVRALDWSAVEPLLNVGVPKRIGKRKLNAQFF